MTAAPLLLAAALSLGDCDRLTHPAHGGESGHADLGEGRVMWLDWWSLEGTATDVTVMECGSGRALRFRAAEARMGARGPFDGLDAALEVVDRVGRAARPFATFERMAEGLEGVARDVTIEETAAGEACACAALYPDLRAEKAPFAL